MKRSLKIKFLYFWPGFTPAIFEEMFPSALRHYDLQVSDNPEVVIYSCFTPNNILRLPDGRYVQRMPILKSGSFLRVFLTGENIEPLMEHCDFAISFSAVIDHPNHLRLPLWVYESRRWGFTAEALVKRPDTDWERIATEKSRFCNFVYAHNVRFRNEAFIQLSRYKRVDAAGRCMNNMAGWIVPGGQQGKIAFIRPYKFTLAVENAIWPGYGTEKLVHPMFVHSIPIYIGDPLARNTFNVASYIDLTSFATFKEMFEFVREVDNNRYLYLNMLAAPYYRDNKVPEYALEETIGAFFDRIFAAARRRVN
jgi:hypothetical protein